MNCNVPLAVDDGNGGTDSCSTTVTIADTQVPVVTCSATPIRPGRGEQELLIEYSAWDECGEVTGSAVIETRCCPLPVADGQVVRIKCDNHEECKLNVDFEHDVFRIQTDEAALVVTATDECGNTATCEVELCTPDDDGDDDD